MAHTRIRVAIAIWVVATVGWLGTLVMAGLDIGGRCDPDHQSQVQTGEGDWQWLPPGRTCGYVATGTYVGGAPSVAMEPSWTTPVLIGLGWLVLVLGARPARRGSGRPHRDDEGQSGGVEVDSDDDVVALAGTWAADPNAAAPSRSSWRRGAGGG